MTTLASVLLLLVAVCGVTAHTIDSRRQAVLVGGALAHVLILAAIPGAVLAVFALGWWGAALGTIVLCAAGATQFSLFRSRFANARGGPSFTVLHANIWLGQADLDAIIRLVDEHGPDVLTVVELTSEADEGLRKRLAASMPHSYVSPTPGGHGTGIYSRHPLLDGTRHDGFVTELLSARVDMPGRPLVFAVHPVPPWPRNPADWVRELALLRQLLNKIPDDDGPVVVAGDFNATQDHKRYRDLQDGRFVDAAVATGAGMIATYPAHTWHPPVIAIDHVLVAEMHVDSVSAVNIPGSDHRGILARLAFGKK